MLFSKTYQKSKIVYRIFGLKFSFPQKKNRKVLTDLQEFLYHTVSPEMIPEATGILRDIQLSVLRLLLEVDKICKKNNISYWLDSGTLLGAVRHKGFIPWDDDIDIGMMREDYDKFQKIFNDVKNNPKLFLRTSFEKDNSSSVLKVCHKDLPTIFVDIFPSDYYLKKLDTKEKISLHNKISLVRKYIYKFPTKKRTLEKFSELRDKYIYDNQKPNFSKHPAIFLGMEFNHTVSRCVFDYETIFPLSEVKFCGHKLPCPAESDVYLTNLYRDYMALPSSLHYHFDLSTLGIEEIIALRRYAKGEKL